ncbi:uncharacterized protein LOC113512623 [Galleria mellonella]|uniref:Uncharacterized protein LOC113512623 n=1 Tax=Galleria mellonella TaxID=7137 RepID=A0ABM3N737_GALME|nr:uncharacterized protein LOC113512623 [Galleria mellonella]
MESVHNTESSTQLLSEQYDILKEKPNLLLLLLNKFVKVQLIRNLSFDGFVTSIDPITYSLIIKKPYEDSFQTILIPGHAILDVTEITAPPNIKPPSRIQLSQVSEIEILDRRFKIVKWLKWNLLPVSELDDKIIFGNATLLPPYTAMDICTDNPMVAMQMKKIIQSMPPDFNPE